VDCFIERAKQPVQIVIIFHFLFVENLPLWITAIIIVFTVCFDLDHEKQARKC